jgi:hypothetical protein
LAQQKIKDWSRLSNEGSKYEIESAEVNESNNTIILYWETGA